MQSSSLYDAICNIMCTYWYDVGQISISKLRGQSSAFNATNLKQKNGVLQIHAVQNHT